jgi:hypothetical protein
MRRWNSRITVLGLACAGLLLAGAPAFAQSSSASGAFGGSGSSSGFGGSSSFGSGGGGGLSSGGAFGSSGSSSGFGGTSSSGNSAFGSPSTTMAGGPSSTNSVSGRSGPSAAIGTTSFLGAYYVNPLALGLSTGSTTGSTTSQANFGTALYNLTTTNQTNSSSSRRTAPASGYFGAPIGVRRLPAYATTLRIKDMPPPESPVQVREDLRNMLAQSGQLDSRDAVRVLMDGPAVVLQGVVADDDERRLVENMVRLTPGVNAIRNELAARNPAP